MKYFFVLGTNATLSLAEIFAVLPDKNFHLLAKDFLVIDSEREIIADSLIKRLGGVIKIGRIISELADTSETVLEKELVRLVMGKQVDSQKGKFNFGFSDYGPQFFNKKNIGLKLKKQFSMAKISSRFVVSKEKNLSSVVITQNKLLTRGIEIVLTIKAGKILIGETLAVQAFKDLSKRDYGRPARDDFSGMLPPKLAQIMINLAQLNNNEAVIVDPFCGSGTILSEAVLVGYKNLFGSDISFKAIENTRKNVNWLKELYKLDNFKLKLAVKDVKDLSKFIKHESVSAVITEPFLGPQRGKIVFSTVIKDLEDLYSLALKEFLKILRPEGRIVMVWPSFYGEKPINPVYTGFKIINMIPESLKSKFIKKTGRNTIIYGRPGQKVYREIVVLDKI